MDFDDTPQEAAFRSRVRSWLATNAPRRTRSAALAHETKDLGAGLTHARDWQAKKAAAGFAGITMPREYGGLGGTPMQAVIYRQEEAEFAVPQGFLDIGLELCIPVLLRFGRPEHKQRYIEPALSGKEIWCQLFSEPGSGSDIAGARLRARAQADGAWVLNGQKIWVSGAHYADYGIVATRSNPDKLKHEGLTFFWVDLKTPGIVVRPLRQASGLSEFTEVFFEDVRIPDSQRLGDVDDGWKIIVETLMLERQAVGAGYAEIAGWRDALEVARDTDFLSRPSIDDGRMRERIVDFYLKERGLQLSYFQALTALSRGQTPGPEFSVGKLVGASMLQQLAYFAMDLLGEDAQLIASEHPLRSRINYAWFWGAAARIAGGSDEIVKNVLAERVLGLPPDIRIDKDRPFSSLRA